MNREEIEEVRRIVKETVLEILDEDVIAPLTDVFNGLEAIAVQFKHSIGAAKGVTVSEETFNVLRFEPQVGNKIGEYSVAARAR